MTYKVTLHGKVYEVQVEKGEAIMVSVNDVATAPAAVATAPVPAAPVAAAAPAAPVVGAGEVVTSPLPGNVLTIKVNAGQSVKKGEVMLIIEAMKMENEILAPRDAVISQVVVSKGATVDTGAALIVLS